MGQPLRIPLHFEEKVGSGASATYLARGPGFTLALQPGEVRLALNQGGSENQEFRSTVVGLRLLGASSQPELRLESPLPGRINHFIGSDSARWRSNIATFAQVHYSHVYPGIDLVFHGRTGELEYDFVVAPGADPALIQMQFAGQQTAELNATGDLILHTSNGDLRQRAPILFQEADGQRQFVQGSFLAREDGTFGFNLGTYDHARSLVIDPVLVYSTYFGSSGSDSVNDLAVDPAGYVYVTGTTASFSDFPFLNEQQNQTSPRIESDGGANAFVARFRPNGQLEYATYLGGEKRDFGNAIAVDLAGNAYVTGQTYSYAQAIKPFFPNFEKDGFPTTPGVFRTNYYSPSDSVAFLTKLNAAGQISYSTFVPFEKYATGQQGVAVVVDLAGRATVLVDFPGALLQLDAEAKTILLTRSYGDTDVRDLALDLAGNFHVIGRYGGSVRTTNGFFGGTLVAGSFYEKVSPDGQLLYSTVLNVATATSLAVDTAGKAYIVGNTDAKDGLLSPTPPYVWMPIKNAFQATNAGGARDAFIMKIDPTLSGTNSLLYSSLLGGSGDDEAFGVALDELNRIYVTGSTTSTNFPLAAALQTNLAGGSDVFVAELNAAGSGLIFSTYFGGGGNDAALGIAVGLAATDLYIAGSTESTNFPVLAPLQTTNNIGNVKRGAGTSDGFVTRIQLAEPQQSFMVNSENDVDDGVCDSAHCSLREAINAANSAPGRQTIRFAENVAVIRPLAPLPPITDSVVIESEVGMFGPAVLLDGSNAGEANGLIVRGGNSELRRLQFSNFRGYGLVLENKGQNSVESCTIGVGFPNLGGNEAGGIWVRASDGNVIGSSLGGSLLCVIAGNNGHGIYISDNSTGTKILGCAIGATSGLTGASKFYGNAQNGIFIDNSPGTEIGGATPKPGDAAGNIISGSGEAGIRISGSSARNTIIRGNILGATSGTPGNQIGILSESPFTLVGGPEATHRNLIGGNRESGVVIQGDNAFDNQIQGNWIGLGPDGQTLQPNGKNGVLLGVKSSGATVGGDTTLPGLPPGNVISGNGMGGVEVNRGSGHTVAGNLIGPAVGGTQFFAPQPNSYGVLVTESEGTVIGGAESGARNIVSGNGSGIFIQGGTSPTRVIGNWFGTDITGAAKLGNSGYGVVLEEANGLPANARIGGPAPGEGNVIAYHAFTGILSTELNSAREAYAANSIYENGQGGIRRQLNGDFTVQLIDARSGGGKVLINGLTPAANARQARLEFFASARCDASGFGEGKIFLEAFIIEIVGGKRTPFVALMDRSMPDGSPVLTATATVEGFGTTEFSNCRAVLEGVDTDGDSILDSLEEAADFGDGNFDGVPDSQQLNVGTVRAWQPESHPPLTIQAPSGTRLKEVDAPLGLDVGANLGAGKLAPFGFLKYKIEAAPPAPRPLHALTGLPATIEVKVFLPHSPTVNRYYLFGPEANNPQPHWYDFTWNGSTGARFEPGLARVVFIDGGRGDNDASVNGQIATVGALVFEGAVPFRFDTLNLLPFDQVLLTGQVSAGAQVVFEKMVSSGRWTPLETNVIENGFFKIIDSVSESGSSATLYRGRSLP
jgi:CSLREA domain-containing protein